ncbi:MAG: hypothetical protein QN182_05610 [Armatimonadota bacterium]|nr:hypothetical protein [Armatimonadota bacterium]
MASPWLREAAVLRLRAGFAGFGGAGFRARFLSVFLASDTFFLAILAPSSELAGPTGRCVRPGRHARVLTRRAQPLEP